jgi:hypothetical protein
MDTSKLNMAQKPTTSPQLFITARQNPLSASMRPLAHFFLRFVDSFNFQYKL